MFKGILAKYFRFKQIQKSISLNMKYIGGLNNSQKLEFKFLDMAESQSYSNKNALIIKLLTIKNEVVIKYLLLTITSSLTLTTLDSSTTCEKNEQIWLKQKKIEGKHKAFYNKTLPHLHQFLLGICYLQRPHWILPQPVKKMNKYGLNRRKLKVSIKLVKINRNKTLPHPHQFLLGIFG